MSHDGKKADPLMDSSSEIRLDDQGIPILQEVVARADPQTQLPGAITAEQLGQQLLARLEPEMGRLARQLVEQSIGELQPRLSQLLAQQLQQRLGELIDQALREAAKSSQPSD